METLSRIGSRLRQLDAYPKTLDDFRIKTFSGAAVTIVSGVLMLILFLSELNYYMTMEVHAELLVDTTQDQKLRINVDITFPVIGCSYLSIDAMDVSGDQQSDLDHSVFKQRLDKSGQVIPDEPQKQDLGDKSEDFVKAVATTLDPNRCESCYGAESNYFKCCNTCDDVKDAYRQKGWALSQMTEVEQCRRDGLTMNLIAQKEEGCRVYGYLEVNKVAGNFHIAPGKSFHQHQAHIHDLMMLGGQKFTTSHTIQHLSFGINYPGQKNPLDGAVQKSERDSMMYQYFVKVVPTTYVNLTGEVMYSSQYSVTKHHKMITGGLFGESGLPGLFVTYELSPMMVKYTEKQRSFMHFLTGVCAIIGGIFTVASLIDSILYRSQRAIQRKMELGKAT